MYTPGQTFNQNKSQKRLLDVAQKKESSLFGLKHRRMDSYVASGQESKGLVRSSSTVKKLADTACVDHVATATAIAVNKDSETT